ncbi:MAG: hypothetical protein JWP89_1369 [Schlesneria sp.]|nr:hypothetical protein [Schlesneria sp.]
MKMVMQKYRLQNQTRRQQVLSIVALCFALHYLLGVGLWSLVIYSQTTLLLRTSSPSLFWWALWGWLPFYSRCWKSATPFAVALLASYFVAERPKVAAQLIWGLLIFTLICASYDIAGEHWDLQTHDLSSDSHMNYYLTWWWY